VTVPELSGDVAELSATFILFPENVMPGEVEDLDDGREVLGCADTVLTSTEAELWGDDVVVMLDEDDEQDETEEDVDEEQPDLGDTDGIL